MSKTETTEPAPHWQEAMTVLIKYIENGNEHERAAAFQELMKLAARLDAESPMQEPVKEDTKTK